MGAFETCCTICVWAYQIRPKLTGLLMDMASYCADGQGKLLDGRGQAFDDWVISDNIIRIVAANVEAMPCSPGTVQRTGDSFIHSYIRTYIRAYRRRAEYTHSLAWRGRGCVLIRFDRQSGGRRPHRRRHALHRSIALPWLKGCSDTR